MSPIPARSVWPIQTCPPLPIYAQTCPHPAKPEEKGQTGRLVARVYLTKDIWVLWKYKIGYILRNINLLKPIQLHDIMQKHIILVHINARFACLFS